MAIALLLMVVYSATGDWNGQDLDVYRAGGSAVLHGTRLYDASFVTPASLQFTYPPFAAIVFAPISLLSESVAIGLWTLCTVLAAGLLVAISFGTAIGSRIDRRWLPHVVIFGGLFATFLSPVQYCMQLGQIGAFLVLLCVADVALPPTRWRRRGVLVGIAVAIKMTPGLFIVYFALTRDWKAVRASVATLVVCWGAAALALPRDSFAYFVGGAGYDARRVGDVSDHLNESLDGFWHRLSVPSPTMLWLGSAALVAAVVLWRARRATEVGDRLVAATLVGVASDLVAPISWLHHEVWVVPAIIVLLRQPRFRLAYSSAAAGMAVILAIPLGKLAGGNVHASGPLVEVYVLVFLAVAILLPFARNKPERTWAPPNL